MSFKYVFLLGFIPVELRYTKNNDNTFDVVFMMSEIL